MNLPIYQKALRYIEANPHAYDPGRWFGAGGCCIIGHIATQQGLDFNSLFANFDSLSEAIASLLDITPTEVDLIADGRNTIEKLQEIEAFYLKNPSALTIANLSPNLQDFQ